MNEPEEGDYGWTTLMNEVARIEDALFIFVRDYHIALSLSNRFSSPTPWSTGRLVLRGAYGIRTPSVM